jgi:hypothetical protein
MGKAPKILEELRQTQEQMLENDRQWFLDTTTGELKPEEDPAEDPQTRPKPVRVARQTFD